MDQRLIHLLVEIKIEAVERALRIAEAGLLVAQCKEPVLAPLQLVVPERGDPIQGPELLRLRLTEPGSQDRGHPGQPESTEREVDARARLTAEYTTADPGHFKTLDLPIVNGALSTGATRFTACPCASSTRRSCAGTSVAATRLARASCRSRRSTLHHKSAIVGVARRTSGEPDAPEELLQVYVPLAQFPTGDVYMVVQPSAGSSEALTSLVRGAVACVDSDVPVRHDRTLERLSIASAAGYRFGAKTSEPLRALTLVLAMVGVFGVLTYTVQQRRREIGVRMALGASSGRVMCLVFLDAGWMIATGAILGVMLAGFSGQLTATFRFGIDPLGPLTSSACLS